MFGSSATRLSLDTPRCYLRPAQMRDFDGWVALRAASVDFLKDWEPLWGFDQFDKSVFKMRVDWSKKSVQSETAIPMLIFRQSDDALVGGITLDGIRRGPVQSGVLGYWIGQPYARSGYMSEALNAIVAYGFSKLDLSRIEAATLPSNKPSRGLLEKCGFKYEGVAQSYIQINGRWRSHVLYANLRHDRRGATDAGVY